MALLVASASMVVAMAGVALANDVDVESNPESGSVTIEAHRQEAVSALPAADVEPPAPEDVGLFIEFREYVDPDDPEDTGYCWLPVVRVYEGANADAAMMVPDAPERLAMNHHGRCPPEEFDVDIDGLLERYAGSFPMPPPAPEIPPGRALTGLPMFLVPGGERSHAVSATVLDGRFDATFFHVGYDVDWGDGRGWMAYRSKGDGSAYAGGPYPDGDIRYAYAERGEVTVRVRQHWAGTWTFTGSVIGDRAGSVHGLWSQGEVFLEIGEVQAIRTG